MNTYITLIANAQALLPFFVVGAAVYLARRALAAVERRANDQAELAELRGRVAQLEEGLDSTERQLTQIKAAQDFATQLLANRISDSPRRVSATHLTDES